MVKQAISGAPFRIVSALALLASGAALVQSAEIGTSKDPGQVARPATPPAKTAPRRPPAAVPKPEAPSGVPAELAVGDAARTITFNDVLPEEKAIVADLPLTVAPPGRRGGSVTVTYTADRDASTQIVGEQRAALSDEHAVVYVGGSGAKGPFNVTRGAAVTIPLRFALPAAAGVGRANGRLRVEYMEKGDKQTPTAAGSVRLTGAAPSVRFDPAKPKLQVTRGAGPFGGLVRQKVGLQVFGPGVEAFKLIGDRKVRLTNDRNGELLGRLSFPEREELGSNYAEVTVDEVNHTGAYSGGVPLDPNGADTATVPLDIKVQDHFWIPLIVLFLSALLGGLGITRWQLARRREILRRELKAAAERYEADGGSGLDWMFSLDPNLGLDDPQWAKNDKGAPAGGWPEADRLHAEIGDAADPAAFTAVGAHVTAIVAEVERWRRILRAAASLRAEVERTRLPRDDEALADAHDLLDDIAERDPGAGDATETTIRDLADQREVLALYARLRKAWMRLPRDHELKSVCDPATLYETIAERKEPKATAQLKKTLALAIHDVLRAQTGRPTRRHIARLATFEDIDVLVEDMTLADAPMIDLDVSEKEPVERDTRSSTQIIEGVKMVDSSIAALTTVVVVVACLLPIYVEHHTFGSWEDYLKLALLGFLGAFGGKSLVIDWGAYPSLASYSVAAATTFPGATGGGGGAGGGGGDGGGDGGEGDGGGEGGEGEAGEEGDAEGQEKDDAGGGEAGPAPTPPKPASS